MASLVLAVPLTSFAATMPITSVVDDCAAYFSGVGELGAEKVVGVYRRILLEAGLLTIGPEDLAAILKSGDPFTLPTGGASQKIHLQRALDQLKEALKSRPDFDKIRERLLDWLRETTLKVSENQAEADRAKKTRANGEGYEVLFQVDHATDPAHFHSVVLAEDQVLVGKTPPAARGVSSAVAEFWDSRTGKFDRKVPQTYLSGAIFAGLGTRVVGAYDRGGGVRAFNLETGQLIGSLDILVDGRTIAVSSNDRYVLLSSHSEVLVWSLAEKTTKIHFDRNLMPSEKTKGLVAGRFIDANGSIIYALDNGMIEKADPDRSEVRVVPGGSRPGLITAAAFTREGRLAATAGEMVQVFEMANSSEVFHHELKGARVSSMAFSADGRFLAVTTGNSSGAKAVKDQLPRLIVFDLTTKAPAAVLGLPHAIDSLVFDQAGEFLVGQKSAVDGSVSVLRWTLSRILD